VSFDTTNQIKNIFFRCSKCIEVVGFRSTEQICDKNAQFLANAGSPKKSSPAAGFKYAAMGSELLWQMTSGINAALRDLSIPLGFIRFGHF